MIFAYHPDLSNAKRFEKQSGLSETFSDIYYPNGYWRQWFGVARGWPDKYTGNTNPELVRFDEVSKGKKVWLFGYSDGASMAHYVANHRSQQVLGVVSYAGRIRTHVHTVHKFPVLILWNGRDKRRTWDTATNVREVYKTAGHYVEWLDIQNDWTHWGGWDPMINPTIVDFMS